MADETLSESKSVRKIKGRGSKPINDLTGRVYGRLTVVDQAQRKTLPSGKTLVAWNCLCECGNSSVVTSVALNSGKSRSCGCYKKEKRMEQVGAKHPGFRHGRCNSREYGSWKAAIDRTTKRNNAAYHRYGGRGIEFCKEWMDFRVFFADMGTCPDGHTLDRIDNEKGYNKANCRWASPTEQARNRRSNVLITIGDESRTAPEWAEISGVPDYAIRQRYDRGWPAEQAVFDPVMEHGQWLGGRGVVKYKIGDRNLTAGEWSKISGVPEKRITTRIHRDKWDPERAIFSPASKGRRAAEKWQDGPLSRDDVESATKK